MNINSYFELDKLIKITNSFNGKIFGNFVREYYIDLMINNYQNIDFDNLNINIVFYSESNVKRFIKIINQHYELNKNFRIIDKNISLYYLVLKYECNGKIISKIINLNIINNNKNSSYNNYVQKSTNNIDLNLLALKTNSLFLLDFFSEFNCNVPKYSFFTIFNRNSNKKFSFIIKSDNLDKYINDLNIAYNMVKNNFIMDDIYNNNISIFIKWENIDKNSRLYYSEKERNKLKNNDKCIICSSKFHYADIIINTQCNHNFHWVCCNNNGLRNWVMNFKISCPICRETNLNFI